MKTENEVAEENENLKRFVFYTVTAMEGFYANSKWTKDELTTAKLAIRMATTLLTYIQGIKTNPNTPKE